MSSHFDYIKIKQMLHPGITRMTEDILGCSRSFRGSFRGFLFAVMLS
jgi:hypothetical protein